MLVIHATRSHPAADCRGALRHPRLLPALDAVLAEPDVAAADRLVLTGDIATGPQPVEVP